MFKIFYGVLLSALILIVLIACGSDDELYYDKNTNQYVTIDQIGKSQSSKPSVPITKGSTSGISAQDYNALLERVKNLERKVSYMGTDLGIVCNYFPDVTNQRKIFKCIHNDRQY